MISSYKQITIRYLKANKKRTILTLIGIILSVALISTIGLFFKGMQAAKREQIISTYGSYHLMFNKTDDTIYAKIANNPKVSRYGYIKQTNDIKLGKDLSANKIEATDEALELTPYKIKEGRMPQNENEAAVEKWVLDYVGNNLKLGDKIKLDKEYKLTGILDDNIDTQFNRTAIILTKNNNILKGESTLLVQISSKTKLSTAVKELMAIGKEGEVQQNAMLLMIEGVGEGDSSLSGLLMALSVIISIVAIATIAVIYNSFQISVVERMKEFGLLRAVGTTPKQIRKIVLKEASILAAIAVPLGLLFGIAAMASISYLFKSIGGDSVISSKLVIDPTVIAISAFVGAVSIYISAFIPSIFAGRISPLVAISSRMAVTKGKIKKSNNRVIQKLFGFEGAMAAKNIKRNRKRYRITIFSIAISVVLFVTFKSFMDMSLTVSDAPNESRNVHFTVFRTGENTKSPEKEDEDIANSIKNLSYVDKVYRDPASYGIYSFKSVIDKSSEIKEIQAMGNIIYGKVNYNGNEKTLIDSSLNIYDNEALNTAKKYLSSGNINLDELNKENGVILIRKNKILDMKTKKYYVGAVANIKVGDIMPIQNNDNGDMEFGQGRIKKVKVVAIVENEPFDFMASQEGLKLITSVDVAKKLLEVNDIQWDRLNIKLKDVKNEVAAEEAVQKLIRQDPNLSFMNNLDSNRSRKSEILMIQILIYGFVIVVSLISCVNIINTLTTNIILRKKEFAALKSIGLTQKGLRKMIVLEGILYAVAGTIYGSIIGGAASFLMHKGLNEARELQWSIPWDAMAIAGIAALIIGYLSILSPLSRIKKENLIEVIREDF